MGIKTTQRIWKAGSTTCIAVPTHVQNILGLEVDDYIEIDWGEVVKKENMKRQPTPKRRKEIDKSIESEPDNRDGLDDILPDLNK